MASIYKLQGLALQGLAADPPGFELVVTPYNVFEPRPGGEEFFFCRKTAEFQPVDILKSKETSTSECRGTLWGGFLLPTRPNRPNGGRKATFQGGGGAYWPSSAPGRFRWWKVALGHRHRPTTAPKGFGPRSAFAEGLLGRGNAFWGHLRVLEGPGGGVGFILRRIFMFFWD